MTSGPAEKQSRLRLGPSSLLWWVVRGKKYQLYPVQEGADWIVKPFYSLNKFVRRETWKRSNKNGNLILWWCFWPQRLGKLVLVYCLFSRLRDYIINKIHTLSCFFRNFSPLNLSKSLSVTVPKAVSSRRWLLRASLEILNILPMWGLEQIGSGFSVAFSVFSSVWPKWCCKELHTNLVQSLHQNWY